jgi:hypothetical protein
MLADLAGEQPVNRCQRSEVSHLIQCKLTVWYGCARPGVTHLRDHILHVFGESCSCRTDASLSDTLDSLISTFNTELNDEGQPLMSLHRRRQWDCIFTIDS